jgi:hypothetical protein
MSLTDALRMLPTHRLVTPAGRADSHFSSRAGPAHMASSLQKPAALATPNHPESRLASPMHRRGYHSAAHIAAHNAAHIAAHNAAHIAAHNAAHIAAHNAARIISPSASQRSLLERGPPGAHDLALFGLHPCPASMKMRHRRLVALVACVLDRAQISQPRISFDAAVAHHTSIARRP